MKKLTVFLIVVLTGMTAGYSQQSKVTTAATYLSNGELAKAKEAIDAAAVNEKTRGEAKTWYYKAVIYQNIGLDKSGAFAQTVPNALDTSLYAYQTAIALPDLKSLKEKTFVNLQVLQLGFFNMGAEAYSAKDYSTAYRNFNQAAMANDLQYKLDSTKASLDTGAIFNAGLCAEKLEKTDDVIRIYNRLIALQYKEPYVYRELAELYMNKNMMPEAENIINAGRKEFPGDESIILEQLNFYLKQGKLTELVDKLNAAIAIDPSNPQLYFVLGNSFGEQMKADTAHQKEAMEKAIHAYQNAIKYKADYFDAYLNLGALYYNKAIDINKVMISLPLDAQAKYEKLEKERNDLYLQALPYFEQALAIDKSNVQLVQSLKEIYARTGNNEKMQEMKKLLGE